VGGKTVGGGVGTDGVGGGVGTVGGGVGTEGVGEGVEPPPQPLSEIATKTRPTATTEDNISTIL
jgi:hypothetical protein